MLGVMDQKKPARRSHMNLLRRVKPATVSTDIALIGFGEAAQALLEGWTGEPGAGAVSAYDLKTDMPGPVADAKWRDFTWTGVRGCKDPAELLAEASLVFSLVTADQADRAAEAAAPHLAEGAVYLDGNSCAPETKRIAASAVEAAGARYVDLAIMAPVRPALHRVPMLVSGPHAEDARLALARLGMTAEVVAGGIGQASTVKMLRSVMIKGIEALVAECLLAARRAGVDDRVIASLQASDPGFKWREKAGYNLERMAVHGSRRAAEMHEVAKTLSGLDLPGVMAEATAEWQNRIGALGVEANEQDMAGLADRMLAALHLPELKEGNT
jgi:3-hydroxyisobutyrate dehydrogenase-like beta-hydroxyacid dehydrogenase